MFHISISDLFWKVLNTVNHVGILQQDETDRHNSCTIQSLQHGAPARYQRKDAAPGLHNL